MKNADIVRWLEDVAPPGQAESWDNVGMLVGDLEGRSEAVLFTVDLTAAVLDEALASGATFVVAYHPPIFAPQKRFTAPSLPYRAAARGVLLFSPHTALDVALGGTNDVLADACGIAKEGRTSLRYAADKDDLSKLVTFVPKEPPGTVERVSRALFEAGAGRIGKYVGCSFRSEGTGTFFGEEGTNPTVGEAGTAEIADEVRVETVVPMQHLRGVVAALRASHPYEEPAFDLVRLAAPPRTLGIGRIGSAPARTLVEHAAVIKAALGTSHLLVAAATDRPISRVAVVAGAGGELWREAAAAGAGLYVTGEMRHHDALLAVASGLSVVCTLHSNSERLAVRALATRMERELPSLDVRVSSVDRDPFAFD